MIHDGLSTLFVQVLREQIDSSLELYRKIKPSAEVEDLIKQTAVEFFLFFGKFFVMLGD